MPDSTETNELGPRSAHVHGYQPMGQQGDPNRQPDPNGLITITGWFDGENIVNGEGMSNWERRSREKFIAEAQLIYEVLSKNLPGGTLHELLICMLQGNLNLHIVQDIPDTTIKALPDGFLIRSYNEPKARVSNVRIGRLYNLGNFEHLKYEIGIEIPEGADALKAFTGLRRLVAALKPMRAKDSYFVRAEEIVAKADTLTPDEYTAAIARGDFTKESITTYREKIARREALADRRKAALQLFNDLGGAETHKDAKDDWDDEDDYDY